VIAAARDAMRETGPFAVSSNDIARRAGVSWGVIQHHFGTRAGILLAVVEDGFAGLLEALDAVPDTDDPLTAVLDAAWAYYHQPDYLFFADIIRVLAPDPESAPRVEVLLQESDAQLAERLGGLLRREAPEGHHVSDDTLHTMQHLVFSTARGLALRQAFGRSAGDDEPERALLQRALRLAMTGEEDW
jgi:AcrR family transcriptional regulator